MEFIARRRFSVLSSHLIPTEQNLQVLKIVRPSNCVSDEGNNPEEDCVFCKIVRGEAPALKIYEDDICLCILDSNPLSLGHSLIIPKCHYHCLEETPPDVVSAMCSKVPFISKAVMRATGFDSFNLLVNNGAAAGQVIFHTHIHIIPRKARDCLWTSESIRRRKLKIDQDDADLASNIRDRIQFKDKLEDATTVLKDQTCLKTI